MRAAFAIILSLTAGMADADAASDRWKTHLTDDLLPFWSDPAASGTPMGSFAGNLCNDGSAPVAGVACSGVSAFRASRPQQTLVGQSRQVFSYAVAFHMTGQRAYLDLARAGLDYQFDTFLDADTGLFKEVHNVSTGAVSGVFDSQKQAYGLLGASFLYYLTGDADIYAQIAPVQDTIQSVFRDPATGGYKSRPTSSAPANPIAKHLDQLNTYQTLLASQAPLADRAGLLDQALQTANYLKDAFYDPSTGLMKPTLDHPDGTLASADFGHSVKSFWFIDQTAKLAGDTALSAFAQNAAKSLFERAFDADTGAWRTNYTDGGVANDRAHWWGFAELNQFAASLAIEDPDLRALLAQTQAYWLDTFVDDTNGGVWGFVDIATGTPDTAYAKHWEWKAGFHSYEHALINYLADRSILDGVAEVFFARSDIETLDLAYGFTGDLSAADGLPTALGTDPVQRVTISNLTYGAAAPVPLPATIWMLAGAVLMLRRRR